MLHEHKKSKLLKLKEQLNALDAYKKNHLLDFVFPKDGPYRRELYPTAIGFFKAGATHRFRAFMGGNRSGKSFSISVELSYHLTGLYPDWWEGRRFRKIRNVWIIAESGALFRDSLQKLLFGESGEDVGTGLLPLAKNNNGVGILSVSAMPGVTGAIGSALIQHRNGDTVSLVVKTNEMSREQFQAAKVDVVAFDEEPREDIYVECMMRLIAAGSKEQGIAMLAFTPLKGMSNVILKFLPNGRFPLHGSTIEDPEKYVCRMEQKDAPHLSKDELEEIMKDVPLLEREARSKGIPFLGSGRIFPVDEDFIVVPTFPIPSHWKRAFGLDFGWTATAAVWVAEDPNTHIRYIYAEYKNGKIVDDLHILNIKERGPWIKGACDPSGGSRMDSGALRMDYFVNKGLDLIPGDNSLISGISRLLSGLETGTYKIMRHLQMLRNEILTYRYDMKDGDKPARNQDDHIIDAWRYLDSRFEDVAEETPDLEYSNKPKIQRRAQGRNPITGY